MTLNYQTAVIELQGEPDVAERSQGVAGDVGVMPKRANPT
jgi:hypothetical protein